MYINQLAWANTTIFDYEGLLKTGSFTLYMWTYAEDVQNEEIMNPLGILIAEIPILSPFPLYVSMWSFVYRNGRLQSQRGTRNGSNPGVYQVPGQ